MDEETSIFEGLSKLIGSSGINDRIFFILQASSLACSANRWEDLHSWYRKNTNVFTPLEVDDVKWDQLLLYRLFDCWVILFRREGPESLNKVIKIIISLRHDQRIHEKGVLNSKNKVVNQDMALRLASLYHLAKATELISLYILHRKPENIFDLIDKHFGKGIEAASALGDTKHEYILRLLYKAGSVMVTDVT